MFQLEPYHPSKSMAKNIYDKQAGRHISRWLKLGNFEEVFNKIEALKYEVEGLKVKKKSLKL